MNNMLSRVELHRFNLIILFYITLTQIIATLIAVQYLEIWKYAEFAY